MSDFWSTFKTTTIEKIIDGVEDSKECSEITETDKVITLGYDMPGASKDSITVTIEKDILIVKGKRKAKNYNFFYSVPATIDPDTVEAKYADGVLEVNMHKKEVEEATVREVTVH